MDKFEPYRHKISSKVPATMQALVAKGRGFEALEIAEVPVPLPGPKQLLARVDAAGVCTSILKLIDQGPDHTFINGWDMAQWPVILGDEGAVTLVKVGDNLQDQYQVGQRFAVQPAVATDPICHRDRYRNQARDMHKCAVGYTLGGNLAQYILIQEEVLKAECLLPLPQDDMSYFAASMAEPISCIVSAQQRNVHIIKHGPHAERVAQLGLLPGGVTVVIGAGAMGRIHAELALRYGPRVLIVSDLVEERLDEVKRNISAKARKKGCTLICVKPDVLEQTIRGESAERGADDIILAVGVQTVQQQALNLLANGGVANLFGGLPAGKHLLSVDSRAVHYQEIKLVGSSGGDPSDMTETLKLIAHNDINAGHYVAAVGSLDNAIDVLRMIKETKVDGKAILYPHVKKTPLEFVKDWNHSREIEFLNTHLL
jgi:L-sorbose 1-phosphate reductase